MIQNEFTVLLIPRSILEQLGSRIRSLENFVAGGHNFPPRSCYSRSPWFRKILGTHLQYSMFRHPSEECQPPMSLVATPLSGRHELPSRSLTVVASYRIPHLFNVTTNSSSSQANHSSILCHSLFLNLYPILFSAGIFRKALVFIRNFSLF